ncbi:MAG: SIS domain-containing protein [Actinobacteria bacterium]|nr:SIS domain-containing protein [Actinomycetota bacterium]
MKEIVKKYFEEIVKNLSGIAATDSENKKSDFNQAIADAIALINKCSDSGKKIMFIGNGASAAISSHMATDFWKNGGIKAIAFNDSSLLTCISNDYGYQYVFEKPVEMFAEKGDILIAISSSGRSENIIKGAKMALFKGCILITLSGFEKENPLRLLGHINFYVPSSLYGPVEIIHQAICHSIIDVIIETKKLN